MLAITIGGLLLVDALFGAEGWGWLLVIPVGLTAGLAGGRGALAWLAAAGCVAATWLARATGLPRDDGPFWFIAAFAIGLLLVAAFLLGTNLGLRRSPLDATRRSWGGLPRVARRAVFGLAVVATLASLGYLGYVGYSGSAQFTEAAVGTADCRTPADRFGWTYEAINFDAAQDERVRARNADRTKCTVPGAEPGTAVVTSDGIRLAGWYIPAANGVGPTGPTLVLVHGWKSSKSGMLDYAPSLHEDYNLLLLDLRNHGQSTGDQTSMGLYEQRDVSRMLDWLVQEKAPSWIGGVGNSMGAGTLLAVAAGDTRIQALVLDSMHADWATSVGNAMEEDFGYPGGPAGWVLIQAVSFRVGGDVTTTDPIRQIGRLGDRPVLLIQGTADQVDPPNEASDRNFQAALEAGVPVELAYCRGARHGLVVTTCPEAWGSWATAFLARARS